MAYLWTTYSVYDVDQTAAFFEKLFGMHIVRQQRTPGHTMLFLGFGEGNETMLELIQAAPDQVDTCSSLSMGFGVPNLEEAMQTAKLIGTPCSEIVSPAPGVRFCFVEDPNGMRIQLFEQK